jgi:hypothetical protein
MEEKMRFTPSAKEEIEVIRTSPVKEGRNSPLYDRFSAENLVRLIFLSSTTKKTAQSNWAVSSYLYLHFHDDWQNHWASACLAV